MSPRLSVLAGLLAGIVVAGLAIGGLLFLGPMPAVAPPATGSPSPSTSGSPLPSGTPSGPPASSSPPPSPTASSPIATGSAGAGPSGSPSGLPSPIIPGLFHIGEPAPVLAVPGVDGGSIDLASYRGRPVWVNFMGTYCPPCQDEFPLMNGFAARYESDGLVVIAVDVREDAATVAAFADGLHAIFPIGLDTDGRAAATWGAVALPVHFWIGADGIVHDGALGGIGPDIMARGVASILPGVKVTP